MELVLDKKDKEILFLLSENSRLPVSMLSRKLKMGKDTLWYRLRRLIDNKMIEAFITEIDETALGFKRHIIYLAFQNVDQKQEEQIISFIVAFPFVSWTTTSTGKWSVILDFLAQDITAIQSFLDQLLNRFGPCVSEHLIFPLLSFEHYPSKIYGLGKTSSGKILNSKKSVAKVSLDTLDKQLLFLLSTNARLDYVSLSKHLKITANAVKNRLKRLQAGGVIKRFTLYPKKSALGYEQYYVQLFFSQATKQEEIVFLSYLKEHSLINAVYRPLAPWSIEIAVLAQNSGQLRQVILDLRNKFGKFIRIHDTMLFYQEPKLNYLPEGVFR
ncbi:MAG: Lrp/AsnC family transcriptional regulator [Nanoarchaeota archaeon]